MWSVWRLGLVAAGAVLLWCLGCPPGGGERTGREPLDQPGGQIDADETLEGTADGAPAAPRAPALLTVEPPVVSHPRQAVLGGDAKLGWRVRAAFDISGSPWPQAWDVAADGTVYLVVDAVKGQDVDTRFLVAVDGTRSSVRWAARVADEYWVGKLIKVPDGPLLVCGSPIVAVDPESGDVLCTRNTPPLLDPLGAGPGMTLCAHGLLYLGGGELALLDPSDLTDKWRLNLGVSGTSMVHDPPVVHGDVAFFVTDSPDGVSRHLWAVDLEEKRQLWQRDLGDIMDFEEQPTTWLGGCATDGHLVVCMEYTTAYWYREAPGDATPLLRCFPAQTGADAWSAKLASLPDGWGGEILPPVMSCGSVFVARRGGPEADAYSLVDGALVGTIFDTPLGELNGQIACPVELFTAGKVGVRLVSARDLRPTGDVLVALAKGVNDSWPVIALRGGGLVAIGRHRPAYQEAQTVVVTAGREPAAQ